jgi:hypothetical protein
MPFTRTVLSGDVKFKVMLQIGDLSDVPMVGLWGSGKWDENVWGVTGDAYMVDVTEYCEQFTTRNGRQTYTSRFRAAKAVIDLDNTGGEWTVAGGAPLPGFLPLRPGRVVQLFVSWNDGPDVQIYEGFIDTIADRYRENADIITRITAYDLLGIAPRANTVAQAEQGSGELSWQRIIRIVEHEFVPAPPVEVLGFSLEDIGTTMLPTTLANDALALLQITADSEGGGVWMAPSGAVRFSLEHYFTTLADRPDQDWEVGSGPIQPVRIPDSDWSAQRIINEAHMARVGGVEQEVSNSGSIGLYYRRTHQRLDLQTDDDTHVADLAQRFVTNLANARAQIPSVELLPTNTDEYEMGGLAEIGDTVRLTVNTIFGWSYTVLTQVFGISHFVTPEEWRVEYLLDDTEFEVQGAFSTGFSDAYDV